MRIFPTQKARNAFRSQNESAFCLKSAAAGIVSSLQGNHLNVNFGLAQFPDYPIAPFGASQASNPGLDFPYALVQDISPPALDSPNANVACGEI